jgi:hypothetical protein
MVWDSGGHALGNATDFTGDDVIAEGRKRLSLF